MKKLGLQLYSIRDVLKTEDEIKFAFSELARYGYSEVELAGFPVAPEKMYDLAKAAGLEFISSHCGWEEMLDDSERIIDIHKSLGTKHVGIGGFAGFDSLESLRSFIEKANDMGKKLAEHDMKFIYHTHNCEFAKFDGKQIFSYLTEGLDENCVSIELDVYWAQFAGVDVCEIIKMLKGKMDIIHLKDMAAMHNPNNHWSSDICEIGFGNMNFEGIISEAEKIGIEHFVVEQDYNWRKSPLESAKESALYLKENFGF